MKKALGQTVRDLKRGVNKKVLKVPSIEQKILDATSNEPWGPHGSILADIAQATRNYHEYQMIMSVIWKRINDTGKNWRHVYKALTVLEYLVAHGSERVIDEIREHAYQISALSDFQYVDSSGRDQGSNVRKKSQSLVVLVNDKQSIQEARQKAAANRDKYSMGGMSRPGSYSSVGGYGERYDDDGYEGRYGSRDEDRNGYGREREWGPRDDDSYGRYGDSNSRDGDRYGKESEEYYGRDGYRDDDSHGRTRSVDDYNYRDRDRDRSYEEDGQHSSSRGNGAKTDDLSQDGSVAGRPFDRKYSEPNIAPPSYEVAVGEARSLTHSERNGETSASSAPKLSSPPPNTSDLETTFSSTQAPAPAPAPTPAPTPAPAPAPETNEFDGFDEFDPRGSFSAAPISSNGAEMDFLGSLSKSFSSNSLAIVSTTTATATLESDAFTNSDFGNGFPSESAASNLPFEDPFGDGPFRAISYTDGFQTQLENVDSTSSFHSSTNHSEPPQPTTQNTETVNNFGFGDTDILADILPPSGPSAMEFPAHTVQPALQTDFQGQINERGSVTSFHGQPDQFSSHTSSPVQIGQPSSMTGFPVHDGQPAPQAGFPHQSDQHSSLAGFPPQTGTAQQSGFPAPGQASQPGANFYGSFNQQSGSAAPGVQPMVPQIPTGPSAQYNTSNFIQQSGSLMVPQMQQAGFNGSFNQQSGSTAPGVQPMVPQIPAGPSARYNTSNFIQQSGSQLAPQMQQAGFSTGMTSAPAPPVSTNSLAIVPQPVKDKFETKSTVWADTLNRGLVNLNISGSKTNPLADIGVDFDAINRKEKRMEKPGQTPVVSTITMGKAMGSGSGIGRAGAGALRGALNPMMGSGIHMGMGGAGMGMGGPPGAGMGMGGARFTGMGMSMGMGMGAGYGVNQPVGGVGMGMNMGVGAGMNTGMGQGVQMQQQPTGFPPGSTMPGGYNPMMGTGNFSQQPYNGGYR